MATSSDLIRQRRFPLVGSGAGVWSFIHVDDAARATQLAIERGALGIYNIVDDDPAEVSEWLPDLARGSVRSRRSDCRRGLADSRSATAGVSMMTEHSRLVECEGEAGRSAGSPIRELARRISPRALGGAAEFRTRKRCDR